ncbi:hypothetical protein BaRGS_00017918 [Batillaria attramentaria]|uniref:Calcineurin-like phosphoesterase domain-containing protein n=1 Tax=Batillaria attramentaria TaxID=370345 RepID=A0ABD0KUK3_9CAEN
MAENDCHLTFGLIADVQYADIEDGMNYAQTRKRYYRASLDLLQRAVTDWKTSHPNIAFVLQLGDLIDGWNRRGGGGQAARSALEAALSPFRDLPCSTFHMFGNHDLYNFTKKQCLATDLNSGALAEAEGVEGCLYYSVVVHPRLRVVVLDTYDVSVLGYSDATDHPNYKAAVSILDKQNPNEEKNSVRGLKGGSKHFVAYNGGLSTQQLSWLDSQLKDAEQKSQNVVICGHVQLMPSPSDGVCAVWNYQEALSVIHSYQCVVACFAGHDHDGSDTVDSAGIHHFVLNGVIETPSDTDAYATAFLRDTVLEIRGVGTIPNLTVPLTYHVGTSEVNGLC